MRAGSLDTNTIFAMYCPHTRFDAQDSHFVLHSQTSSSIQR